MARIDHGFVARRSVIVTAMRGGRRIEQRGQAPDAAREQAWHDGDTWTSGRAPRVSLPTARELLEREAPTATAPEALADRAA